MSKDFQQMNKICARASWCNEFWSISFPQSDSKWFESNYNPEHFYFYHYYYIDLSLTLSLSAAFQEIVMNDALFYRYFWRPFQFHYYLGVVYTKKKRLLYHCSIIIIMAFPFFILYVMWCHVCWSHSVKILFLF